MKKYSLILADPAWNYRCKAAGKKYRGGAAKHYPTMKLADICALPVGDLAARNCLLALWWVGPMPAEALAVVRAWGFHLVTMKGFSWHKRTKNGKSHVGCGTLTRANSEDCLFARRGRPKRRCAAVRSVIDAPRGRHSEKPAEARERLVQLLGDVPRIELFARRRVRGWDAWGNQVRSSIRLKI